MIIRCRVSDASSNGAERTVAWSPQMGGYVLGWTEHGDYGVSPDWYPTIGAARQAAAGDIRWVSDAVAGDIDIVAQSGEVVEVVQ